MRVVAVILNWRRPDDTIACARSVIETAPDADVIVVDNASGDGSAARFRAELPGVTVLENQHNLGYAGGNNVGISAALGRVAEGVLVLNNDLTVRSGCVGALVEAFDRDPHLAVAGPVSLRAEDPAILDFFVARFDRHNMALVAPGRGERWRPPAREEPTDYVTGSAILVHAEAFALEGHISDGFDERFFLVWEDVDLCLSILRGNPSGRDGIVAVPTAEVLHEGGTSFGPDRNSSPLYQYFFVRNSFLIVRKHVRWPRKTRTLRMLEQRYRGWVDKAEPAVGHAIALGLEHGLAQRYGPPPPELMPPDATLPPG